MTTQVTVNGAVVSISGTQGSLSVMEDTLFGPEGMTIASGAEFLLFCRAIQIEAKHAWPNITIGISMKPAP